MEKVTRLPARRFASAGGPSGRNGKLHMKILKCL